MFSKLNRYKQKITTDAVNNDRICGDFDFIDNIRNGLLVIANNQYANTK